MHFALRSVTLVATGMHVKMPLIEFIAELLASDILILYSVPYVRLAGTDKLNVPVEAAVLATISDQDQVRAKFTDHTSIFTLVIFADVQVRFVAAAA
ncbi:MAG: hypothetical protein NT092_02895 [Bacteroidia bacterium]|nr:hypothetical protein [Bacteroidia bacterium]